MIGISNANVYPSIGKDNKPSFPDQIASTRRKKPAGKRPIVLIRIFNLSLFSRKNYLI
jgi:hypothetical protein